MFVHRAEMIAPQVIADLEKAMAPATPADEAAEIVAGAKLGRFVRGGITAVAHAVGQRINFEYRSRGLKAVAAAEKNAQQAGEPTVAVAPR